MHRHTEHLTRALFATRLEDDDGAALARMLAEDWGAAQTKRTVEALEEAAAYLGGLVRACRVAIERLEAVNR